MSEWVDEGKNKGFQLPAHSSQHCHCEAQFIESWQSRRWGGVILECRGLPIE